MTRLDRALRQGGWHHDYRRGGATELAVRLRRIQVQRKQCYGIALIPHGAPKGEEAARSLTGIKRRAFDTPPTRRRKFPPSVVPPKAAKRPAPRGWDETDIPKWNSLTETLRDKGIQWGVVMVSSWKGRTGSVDAPKAGSRLTIGFGEGFVLHTTGEPPRQLGFSPITTVHTEPEPVQPTTEELGPSTITTCVEEPPTPEETAPATNPRAIPAPDTRPENARNKKRKGKTPSPQGPYAIKRQLDDKEARKIASAPPVGDTAGPAPDNTTPSSSTPTPSPTQKTQTPRTPSGIRWLRKKDTLVNEGKKTNSAVVYLENHTNVGRVSLGGRWLRVDQDEWDRGRK
ncbi:hypothetical protein BDZ91DRAFT_802442 [Kalaharituber pfeilii]|nr:hypothetical protein BDZ91DRAFT_802442 [Kalaharituber pfeilii]